jgi:glycosyltransferase involved in cell wall biosynthesis
MEIEQLGPRATGTSVSPSPTFSVVIPTLGRNESLTRTLQSVGLCRPLPSEIVVVDGDTARSAEEVVNRIAGSMNGLRYLHSEPGLTHQRNRALDEIGGDVIVFLDDDVEVPRDVFSRLADHLCDPSVVGIAARIVEPVAHKWGGKESVARALLPGGGKEGCFTRFGYPRRIIHPDRAMEVEVMQGCFIAARTEESRAVGFDERLLGYALAEDEDFSFRLSRLGRILYVPSIVVNHHNTGFAQRDRRAFGRQVVANRSYLFKKNFSQTLLARFQFGLLIAILMCHRLINLDWRGALGIAEGAIDVMRPRR